MSDLEAEEPAARRPRPRWLWILVAVVLLLLVLGALWVFDMMQTVNHVFRNLDGGPGLA